MMVDECKECKLPPTKHGAPIQAGIFILSETQGVLVSNFDAPDDRVRAMLNTRFGDKFRVISATVKCVKMFPPVFLWYFEVKNDG